MSLHIHTYCLTLPQSDRHIYMQAQLQKKCRTYEFVFNDDYNGSPPLEHVKKTPYWKKIVGKNCNLNTNVLLAIERSWACKAGMLKVMQKIIADNRGWVLFVQDDVVLVDDWLEKAEKLIEEAPPHTDRIVATHTGDTYQRGRLHANNSSYCTETAMLLTPEFASRYIRANGISTVESDLAPLYVDGIGNLLFPTALAVLACTKSTIANE